MRSFAVLAVLTWVSSAHAADLNQASQADIETIKGVGPALSQRIVDARTQQPFSGWSDLARRVPGLGAKRMAQWSDQGWTVAGALYSAAAAASPASAASAASR